ncbi:type II toxin-antitoxin system PemK/MazF family toxin [Rhizorhabdus histidinilytica]|uniref:type II toxin-antitoxin system PemK/MazF family toxin n=1 Tax=Rhizorhabdus histidinilytica TaxID=439228 RepID=UPI001AD9E646|nr:type II toxin-antitoxin system PemK/MazF family toxin [Rhizorhabdus histidinilytica]
MALKFYPRAGQIYIADFTGFVPPEMNKKRPVVVISPRLPYRSEIVALVPLSTTPPIHNLPFCVRLAKNYMPGGDEALPVWAKCDMLINVGMHRLDAIKVGRRQYAYPKLDAADLDAVKAGVLWGLGMGTLPSTPS